MFVGSLVMLVCLETVGRILYMFYISGPSKIQLSVEWISRFTRDLKSLSSI